LWFKTKRETPNAKWNCSIMTDRLGMHEKIDLWIKSRF
jgi:hypothetical protein